MERWRILGKQQHQTLAQVVPTPTHTSPVVGNNGMEEVMQQGFKDIVQRMDNAMVGFVESIERLGDLNADDAQVVANFYLKSKLAKMDAVIGRISVKHGAYLDKEIIVKALGMAKEAA